MKAAFLTVHEAASPRKVDFHFWADILTAHGHSVDFITVGQSACTALKKNARPFAPPFNRWVATGPHTRKFVWRPIFHPLSLSRPALDAITAPLFSLYPRMMPRRMTDGLRGTRLFIIENGAGLMLVPALKKKFPDARFIYSVCDRIATLGYHPLILRAEAAALKHFDLVRVPAQVMLGDFPDHPNAGYFPHGLEKERFDAPSPSPYAGPRNMVGVGDMLFDAHAVETLAKTFPDWTIHLFGRNARLETPRPNVIEHGEQPFEDIVPYIAHADIGLAPYRNAPNADYLSQSSMKMIQYSYCALPILAPRFAATGRAHVFGYEPGDEAGIESAARRAMAMERRLIDREGIMSWEQTTRAMLRAAGLSL